MNIVSRFFYNISLRIRNRNKNFIERLYYKAFPDRVKDHEIATAPIMPDYHVYERFAETRYQKRVLSAFELVPREIVDGLDGAGLKEFEKMLKLRLVEKFYPELEKRVVIKQSYNIRFNSFEYNAYLEIFEEV